MTSTRPAPDPAGLPAGPPVARLRGPGDIAAVVPSLLGFSPQQCLVVLVLGPPRRRIRLTMRVDLPAPDRDDHWAALSASLRPGFVQADGDAVALCVYSPEPAHLDAALRHLRPMCDEYGLELVDALRVDGGRWFSGVCSDPQCCPPDGLPVPQDSAAVAALVVEDGRLVRGSRAELRGEFTRPADAALDAQLARALLEVRPDVVRDPRRGVPVSAMAEQVDGALAALTFGGLRVEDAVRLAVLVGDGERRDAVYRHLVGGPDHVARVRAHRALWAAVCRLLGEEGSVIPLMLFALAAYLDGDGAAANLALERALGWDPDHPTVLLIGDVMAAAIPPRAVRAALADAVGAIPPCPPGDGGVC